MVLAAAANATKTIKLGTGVLLVQQRDTIQTAKLVASIDQVSHGRFLLGIGGGWNQDEMENHGTVYATRFKRVRESIEAMKEIWTKPKAEYHGEFVNFRPGDGMAETGPETTSTHPRRRRLSERRTACDPSIATVGSRQLEVIPASTRSPELKKMARDGGRDPASLEITSFGLSEDLDRLKRLKDIGVARVVPMFPPEESTKVMPIIERRTKLMQQVNR